MVSVGTYLRIIDNYGVVQGQCLKILKGSPKSKGYAGDIVIISATKISPGKKAKKGEIYKAVIVSTRKSRIRFNGFKVQFDANSAVLVNNKNIPLGTRILGPVMLELRDRKFFKILSLSRVAF